MEEAIPYYGDLQIDASTRKLILNLIGSIRTVVPVVNPPGPGTSENDPEIRTEGNIRSVLIHARQHAEELEGLFDPDELLKYSNYISDYQDIIDHLTNLLQEVKNCRDSACLFASKMADMVEDHLTMIDQPTIKPEGNLRSDANPVLYRNIKLKVV